MILHVELYYVSCFWSTFLIFVENPHPCLTVVNPISAICKSAQVCSKNTAVSDTINLHNLDFLMRMINTCSNNFAPKLGFKGGNVPRKSLGLGTEQSLGKWLEVEISSCFEPPGRENCWIFLHIVFYSELWYSNCQLRPAAMIRS